MIDSRTEAWRQGGLEDNEISGVIVNGALTLHGKLGHGFLESAYQAILARQLSKNDPGVRMRVPSRMEYDDEVFGEGLRADLIVADRRIVALQSAETLPPVHASQLLTHRGLASPRVGLPLDFGEALMNNGIHRVING